MSSLLMRDVPAALRSLHSFRTRTAVVLRAERFHRLSGEPAPLDGLSAAQRVQIRAAAQINRAHYLPHCATCGQTITFDHTAGGFRTFLHENEAGADHVAELAQSEDNHSPHPDGLAYTVWADSFVIAWVTNGGTVHHVKGTEHARYRDMVRAELGDEVSPIHD